MNSDNDTQPRRAPFSADQRYRLCAQGIDALVTLVRSLFWALVALAIAYWTKDVLVAYAGKSTMADVALRLVADLQIDRAAAYIFGGGGVAYGLQQRRLLRRNIARLTPRAKELETRIDPDRSSSGLTATGTTPPRDRR